MSAEFSLDLMTKPKPMAGSKISSYFKEMKKASRNKETKIKHVGVRISSIFFVWCVSGSGALSTTHRVDTPVRVRSKTDAKDVKDRAAPNQDA